MKLSADGISHLSKSEGFRSTPYLCQAGKATIGFGNTYYEDGTKVKLSDPPITKERAIELRNNIINKFCEDVCNLLDVTLNQNNFDILISVVYNIGIANFKKSTLRKVINDNGSVEDIRIQILRWNKVRKDGKLVVSNGLTKRRKKEAAAWQEDQPK